MTEPFDVCVVGSANLDLVATAPRLPAPGETVRGTAYAEHPGGKGLNQATAAARAGARTAFVSAVGADAAGRHLVGAAAAAGVDVSLVAVTDAPTGRALITVEAGGENAIVVVPGANALVAGRPLPRCRVVLAQLEIPLDAVGHALRAGRDQGATTILNPAPATALAPELLALVDVLVPNEHELTHLGGPDALLGAGVDTVLTTMGAAGVDVRTASGGWHQPPFRVNVVDTTAAGDAFCGALAARLAAGDALAAAVRIAAAAGALATTMAGALPSIPDVAAVAALLAAQ